MSVFASRHTKTIEIPGEPGQTVTIRKLTGKEVERAQSEYASSLASGRSRSFAMSMRAMLAKSPTDKDAASFLKDPLTGYDRCEVLYAGVVGWTLTKTTDKETFKAELDDLDDEAAEFLARGVLELTKPALFQTAEQAEAAAKKG